MVQGQLSAMSGAGNLSYMEYGGTGRGRGRAPGTRKPQHSQLFKKAMRR